MDGLEFYVYKEIDEFAKQYENAPIVNDLIGIKLKFTIWLDKHMQSIHDYYRSEMKENKISFICRHATFKIRLTFFRSGHVNIYIDHTNSREKKIEDRSMMSRYCMDVGSVYFIESEFGWKIGKTRNLKRRKNIFEVKLPFHFVLRYHIKSTEISNLEKQLHEHFKDKQINGEWFLITENEIKEYINQIPHFKINPYPPDKGIEIDKKYLNLIIP